MASSSGGNGHIKVVVRVRPLNTREKDRGATCIVSMRDEQTTLTPPSDTNARGRTTSSSDPKTFAFDKSYWSFDKTSSEYASQQTVFDHLGRPLLDNAFGGYNNCIFAYGQTGSGKSYSMMGSSTDRGIIPRICEDMFVRIDQLRAATDTSCTIEVSYLEIYNERVRDLLNPSTKGNLKVREHPATGPYVEDLAKLAVRTFDEIKNLMDEGNKARTVAATNMNESSSRSHAVFTITLTQTKHDKDTDMTSEKVAKISLVDLAGSERANASGATGARLKEGAEINRSLSTLGRVIAALADLSSANIAKKKVIPYRDSVLTWLLKDSLGGNSLTAMIAAISPADINYEDTLSTLRYADSAKRIKNHAVVNEDPNARMISDLKAELAQLRSKLLGNNSPDADSSRHTSPSDDPLDQQFVSITQADGTTKSVSKADLAEQLSQSEKLYTDLNQTWEQKLQKTEQVHKEREAALEELGISIEKGYVGLTTPKRMPHLVNLSEDALLAECPVYNLKPGTTTVGNVDLSQTADIRLNGTNILQDHCMFENYDGIVTVTARPDAAVMVNGVRVESSERSRTGCRVILGDYHLFRFNHPLEAKAQRDEAGSKLRHSVILDSTSSPSVRPAHDRALSNLSQAESDFSIDRGLYDVSPIPFAARRHETDWTMARREAVFATLSPDQKMADLTDDDLDVLFDDLQRIRAVRRTRDRKPADSHQDDETDSAASFPQRDKYMSGGTLDNMSLDTALTLPSTPHQDDDETTRVLRQSMQVQLETEKASLQAELHVTAQLQLQQAQAEKNTAEQSLRSLQDEMLKRLHVQKEEYTRELRAMRELAKERTKHPSGLSAHEIKLVIRVLQRWRSANSISIARSMVRNTALIKEAQILSQRMAKDLVFQFVIVEDGHVLVSTYDLVMSDVSSDVDDMLDETPKSCLAVRAIDFRANVIHVWSLQKLQQRTRASRQIYQYLDRPEYIKHLQLDNTVAHSNTPKYSRIGDAEIALAAVFACQVKEMTLDVISPYTFTLIGILRCCIEPSSAEAPSSTLKFSLVMHNLAGFSEVEGTDVHAQLYVPTASEVSSMSTTGIISGFGEGPIVLDSVHSMSVAMDAPHDAVIRISFFARVTSTHLDKLLSWDDMRDAATAVLPVAKRARRDKSEDKSEQHDVFVKLQVLELGEDGVYRPSDVLGSATDSTGIYQLHQGLQRRLRIDVKGTSGASLPWTGVSNVRVGQLHLRDPSGKTVDMVSEHAEVALSILGTPAIYTNRDYTTSMTLLAHWDTGAHASRLLDRPTAEGYTVRVRVSWEMQSVKLGKPLLLSHDVTLKILSRSFARSVSLFSQLFSPINSMHSTSSVYSLDVKRVSDGHSSWMDASGYVAGEESLEGWSPRGVSLVKDYILARRARARHAAVERTVELLATMDLADSRPCQGTYNHRQRELVKYVVSLWTRTTREPALSILLRVETSMDMTTEGINGHRVKKSMQSADTSRTRSTQLVATATLVSKAPVRRASYMLIPNVQKSQWQKRHVELRGSYLYIGTPSTHELVDVLNLSDARIDHEPNLAALNGDCNADRSSTEISGPGDGKRNAGQAKEMHVFAIYGRHRTQVLATATEHDRTEWIFAIDASCFATDEGSGSESASESVHEDEDEVDE